MMHRPTIIKVFLPAFSISTRDTKVMATFMAPMPRVADWLADSSRPAPSKILVEKKMAALIPTKIDILMDVKPDTHILHV